MKSKGICITRLKTEQETREEVTFKNWKKARQLWSENQNQKGAEVMVLPRA